MWEQGGAEALRSLGRPGYPCLLTEDQVRVLVAELERGAVAHGFENERWIFSRVNEVIERLFGVCFADDSGVWRLLKRIGWSAHRAGRRSAARDPEAVARFRDVTWPQVLERARAAGTWIVFEDEAAAMLNARGATTWAKRGRRVWLTVAASHRRKLSMAGFVCYRRASPARLYYACAPDASFTEDDFGPLLLKLRAHLEARRVILVWDRLSAHATSRKTRAFLAENTSWLHVELLPTARTRTQPRRAGLGLDQGRAPGQPRPTRPRAPRRRRRPSPQPTRPPLPAPDRIPTPHRTYPDLNTPSADRQTALNASHNHRLYAAFHLIALRGLRRAETAGLRWCDIDLDHGILLVNHTIQRVSGRLTLCPPKSEASRRTVALDHNTVKELRRHRESQLTEARERGFDPGGFVFTNRRGQPLNPDHLYREFIQASRDAGLPPIRLHDLRHGAGTLALEAGNEMKVIQDKLGHASILLTADTYVSVTPTLARREAESTARLVRDAARNAPGCRQRRRTGISHTAARSRLFALHTAGHRHQAPVEIGK